MCLAGEAREYWYAGTETGGRMILCGDKMDVSEEGAKAGGGCPPRKDTRRRGERTGQVKNSYVIISDKS